MKFTATSVASPFSFPVTRCFGRNAMFCVERDPLIEFMRTISKIDVGKSISRSALRVDVASSISLDRCCEFDFARLILRVDVVTVRSRNRYCEIDVGELDLEIDVAIFDAGSMLQIQSRDRCCEISFDINFCTFVLLKPRGSQFLYQGGHKRPRHSMRIYTH